MKLEIYPYLFTRYAGLPTDRLNQLELTDANKYWLAWTDSINHKKQCTEVLCNLLFELINKEQDERQRKMLLNLKRAVFNDRSNIELLVQKLNTPLHAAITEALSSFYRSREQHQSLLQHWEELYQETLASNRIAIKQLVSSDLFQNGVLLSSKDLYEQLDSFVATPWTDIDKRKWRTEFSILRYLTRMAYKTSPFSTFTYLGVTVLSKEAKTDITLPKSTIHSKIRLNNKLLKRIKGLMEKHDGLNNLMYVSLNSSVRIENDRLTFLMNSANIETFQAMPVTALNQFIYDKLIVCDKEVQLCQLTDQLSDSINAKADEIKQYLLKLVDIGLLELSINCSEINPDWENKLLTFLTPHISHNQAAAAISHMLEELHNVKIEFSHADTKNRNILLNHIVKKLDGTFALLEKQAGLVQKTPEDIQVLTDEILDRYRSGKGFERLPYIPFDYRQEGILYEDTYINEVSELPSSEIESITEKLNSLCLRIAGLDRRQQERQNMVDFFKKSYRDDTVVPVIDFYKAYYTYKDDLYKKEKPHTAQKEQLQDWELAFQKDLENCIYDENGIYITQENFASLPVTDVPLIAKSAFIQTFKEKEDGKIQVVINGLMPGMGKLSGRFLYLFNPHITTVQREKNLSLASHNLMMELNDGSSFNANIHPPLLNHEVKIPASNTIMNRRDQIPLHKIAVTYGACNNRLKLIDRESNKEIYAFDLCLETLTNRSNLYQMLSHFNPIPYISYYTVINVIDQYYSKIKNELGIQINPRITYEKDIVLRRKGWVVDKSIIPVQEENQSESVYFLKIKQWIKANGIPDDVFIFLRSSHIPKPANTMDKTGMKDDYKPQYISFNQILLVKLFKRLIQRAGSHIYLEEVLPKVRQHNGSTSSVTEHLLQWYGTEYNK